jgi:hypothetical protein
MTTAPTPPPPSNTPSRRGGVCILPPKPTATLLIDYFGATSKANLPFSDAQLYSLDPALVSSNTDTIYDNTPLSATATTPASNSSTPAVTPTSATAISTPLSSRKRALTSDDSSDKGSTSKRRRTSDAKRSSSRKKDPAAGDDEDDDEAGSDSDSDGTRAGVDSDSDDGLDAFTEGDDEELEARFDIDGIVDRVINKLQDEQAKSARRPRFASGTPVSHEALDGIDDREQLNRESIAPECPECIRFLTSYRQHLRSSHNMLVDHITQEWIELWFAGNFQLVRGVGVTNPIGEVVPPSPPGPLSPPSPSSSSTPAPPNPHPLTTPILYSRNKFLKEEVNPFLRAMGLSQWHVRTPLYKEWFLRHVMKQSEKELRKAGPFFLRRKATSEAVERQLFESLRKKFHPSAADNTDD